MVTRQLSDHRYKINSGSWIDCTSENTTDNGDGSYTITVGNIAIPIGGLQVQVKPIGVRPASASLTNTIAYSVEPELEIDPITQIPDMITPRGIPKTTYNQAKLNLITQLDSAGLKSDLLALYDNVGDTLEQATLNLVNPVENDQYRGTPSVSASVGSDGVTGGVDTHIVDSSLNNNKTLFFYKRINTADWSMGVFNGNTGLAINDITGSILVHGEGGNATMLPGMKALSVTPDGNWKFYNRGTLTTGIKGNVVFDIPIAYSGLGTSSGPNYQSSNMGLAGVFKRGITQQEMITLDNIVETFESSIKRSRLTPNPTVRFFGDSITNGFGANQRWTTILSKMMGWNEINYGQGGMVLVPAYPGREFSFFDSYQTLITNKLSTDKLMFISFGTNEAQIWYEGIDIDYKSTLITVLQYAITKGWSPSDIVINTGYKNGLNPSYNNLIKIAAEEACAQIGVTKVFDMRSLMESSSFELLLDHLHPNDRGHAFLAIKTIELLNLYGITSEWT